MRVYDLKRVDAADALDDACFDLAHAESAVKDAHKIISRLSGLMETRLAVDMGEEIAEWLSMYGDMVEKPAPKKPREGDWAATDLLPSPEIPFINTKEVSDDQA